MPKLTEDFTYTQEIKKSKFITVLHRTTSEQEAKEFLKQIKKEYPNATHYCTAMIIGNIVRSNDDGEPSGTAGHPMLDVLMHQEMDDIFAVVIRYFGGIKLGTGGLARAYSSGISQALAQAHLCSVQTLREYRIDFSYEWIGKIDACLRKHDTEITLKKYEETVQYQYTALEDITQEVLELTNGQVKPVYIRDVQKEIPVRKEG
ncbi:MAG: YigZ family protein [Erysipelotrichaceae bacterium]|nr:YigZ family protein [Erysipelotrichaceae bacterium]